MIETTEAKSRPLTFVLVEDDEDHATLASLALKRGRPEDGIVHLRDGVEALDYLASPDKPEKLVVLLDLNLPRIGGIEVLERIKSDPKLGNIPVVVLTTSDAESDRLRAYRAHANSYLVKPANFQRFSELLCDAGNYWARHNQPPPLAG